MRRPAAGAAALLLALLAAACAAPDPAGPELNVSGAYVPRPAMADLAAGYLTVTNTGGTDAELTSVTSDLSDDVTMHTVEGSRMKTVGSLVVPAGGRLVLERGGNHLMLADLKRRPAVGDEVSLTLHFTKADPVEVRAPVEPTTYRPEE